VRPQLHRILVLGKQLGGLRVQLYGPASALRHDDLHRLKPPVGSDPLVGIVRPRERLVQDLQLPDARDQISPDRTVSTGYRRIHLPAAPGVQHLVGLDDPLDHARVPGSGVHDSDAPAVSGRLAHRPGLVAEPSRPAPVEPVEHAVGKLCKRRLEYVVVRVLGEQVVSRPRHYGQLAQRKELRPHVHSGSQVSEPDVRGTAEIEVIVVVRGRRAGGELDHRFAVRPAQTGRDVRLIVGPDLLTEFVLGGPELGGQLRQPHPRRMQGKDRYRPGDPREPRHVLRRGHFCSASRVSSSTSSLRTSPGPRIRTRVPSA